MTRLKMKLKNQSKKPLKSKRRQTKLPREAPSFSPSLKPTEYTAKNAAETKNPKPYKSHRKLVVKQKVLKKRLIVIQRHQKWLQGLAAYQK